MHRTIVAVALIVAAYAPCRALELSSARTADARMVIAVAVACEFDRALAMSDSLIRVAPADPVPCLLRMCVLGLRELDFEEAGDNPDFATTFADIRARVAALERTAGETSLTMTIDAFSRATMTAHLLRAREYVKAVGLGLEALGTMKRARAIDPANADVDFFLGLYECARSELKKKLWWLLFWYPGDRRSGIDRLERARTSAVFSRLAASMALGHIYMDDKAYPRSAAIIDTLRAAFPASRFVLWMRARYLRETGDPAEAARLYGQLRGEYERIPAASRNALLAMRDQAATLREAGERDSCVALCRTLLHRIDPRRRTDPFFDELHESTTELLRKAESHAGR